jgi:hypothetical protein
MKHIRGFCPQFQHHVNDIRIAGIKPAVMWIKLIAQNQAQFGQRWLLRQRSEQYLTSSQHFAHFLRHVMGRWQCTHARLGRFCLLPLKSLIFSIPD